MRQNSSAFLVWTYWVELLNIGLMMVFILLTIWQYPFSTSHFCLFYKINTAYLHFWRSWNFYFQRRTIFIWSWYKWNSLDFIFYECFANSFAKRKFNFTRFRLNRTSVDRTIVCWPFLRFRLSYHNAQIISGLFRILFN